MDPLNPLVVHVKRERGLRERSREEMKEKEMKRTEIVQEKCAVKAMIKAPSACQMESPPLRCSDDQSTQMIPCYRRNLSLSSEFHFVHLALSLLFSFSFATSVTSKIAAAAW